eukprot:4470950-Pleurochrysis_carterae.AAC.1
MSKEPAWFTLVDQADWANFWDNCHPNNSPDDVPAERRHPFTRGFFLPQCAYTLPLDASLANHQ